jgi:hypothetical protein
LAASWPFTGSPSPLRSHTCPTLSLHLGVAEARKPLSQAAANVSIVRGTLTAERAKAMSSRGREVDPSGGQDYTAAALSLVFHSKSPMVPTFRADVRYFQVNNGRPAHTHTRHRENKRGPLDDQSAAVVDVGVDGARWTVVTAGTVAGLT